MLRAAQIKSGAVEAVFYGADTGEEVIRKGTPIEFKYSSNFARSMSIDDAMNPVNLLCYEMNGSPLPADRQQEDLLGKQRADHQARPDRVTV